MTGHNLLQSSVFIVLTPFAAKERKFVRWCKKYWHLHFAVG